MLSGDLGHYDEEGYFTITDRLKELIKYKGFQVSANVEQSQLFMDTIQIPWPPQRGTLTTWRGAEVAAHVVAPN